MKKILCVAFVIVVSATAFAQSGTNSPYSQYGLGKLSDQATGFNSGMNGLGIGFREHNQINILNPASYSALDSLSFIFDIGLSGQLTNFSEGNKSINAKNADLEYVVAGFRAFKNVGVSFGLLPYSNIGYNFESKGNIDTEEPTTYTNMYSGSGGLHQAFVGVGVQPIKNLSIGANFSYLWGNYARSMDNTYGDDYANTLSKYYTADIRNYKVDLGLQYNLKFLKSEELTIGVSYGLGHNMKATPECRIISRNSQTAVSDTTSYSINNGLSLPTSFGVGLMWMHNSKWKVGVDYSLQKWGSVKSPLYEEGNNNPYSLVGGQYKDRHKVIFGGEYLPNALGRNFFGRIRYRAGVSYTTPYLKINGLDGPSELSASFGFGIPIMNTWTNRSTLNISAQWVRTSAKNFIKENNFRITIGLTFNERWFAKWKVE